MSGFLVSFATMDRIVHAIIEQCRTFEGIAVAGPLAGTRIGRALYALNVAGIGRLPRGAGRDPDPRRYRYVKPDYGAKGRLRKLAEQYQAIACLLYQTNSCALPARAALITLERLQSRIAAELLTYSPLLENLPFDFPTSPERR